MNQPASPAPAPSANRRDFLKAGAAATVAGSITATLGAARMAHAAGSDTLKVALIGCGGRGRGAAVNAMNADPNVKLTVLCDIFPDQVEAARKLLARAGGDKYAVDDDHCFS